MSRIIEFFFFTRSSTDYHGSFFMSRIIELSNFSFSHGVPRRITDIYFLSRIIDLSNFSFHTEFHGESRIYFFCHEFANSKIRDKEKISVVIRDHPCEKRKTVIIRDIPCDENSSGTRVMMGYSAAE